MPERSQELTLPGYTAADLMALTYGAFSELNWATQFATDSGLVAYTPRKWNKYDDLVTVETENGRLVITSKMIHGEIADLMGRNKKNIVAFLSAFEIVRAKASESLLSEWKEKIDLLKQETLKAAEQEIKEAQEVDKVMNFSTSNLYVTYTIMAVNILVFVLMIISGVNLFRPAGVDIIHWGANFSPLTLSGDWWRLISSVFVHIGIIHLAFNMYALYMAGVYLEPLLGKIRYTVAYLCTGVFASLTSLWWHKEPVSSAGASGAVFGLYGLFLAFLTTKFLPQQIRKGLLQSIGVFMVYNLLYGMRSGVDNAAHVGGLVSGFIAGYIYYLSMKGAGSEKKTIPVVAAIIAITLLVTAYYLGTNKVDLAVREKVKNDVEFFGHSDAERFNEKYNMIIEMQDKALAPLKNKSLAENELAAQLENISLPEWEKAGKAAAELREYKVPASAKEKAGIMQQYIELRKEEVRLRLKWVKEKEEKTVTEINEINNRINKLVEELESR